MVVPNPTGKGGFKKGEVNNPKGRPTRQKEERYLKSLFARVKISDWQAIVDRAIQDAKRGDNVARKWLADYLLGQPIQRQEITGADGNTITIKVVYDNGIDGQPEEATR